jgi:ABC-type glutathione transport system ATPase component
MNFCFVRIIILIARLLEVRGLAVELPTGAGWVRPGNEVSLRIGEGESFGLVGESGSRKTMLSRALMVISRSRKKGGSQLSGASLTQSSCRNSART